MAAIFQTINSKFIALYKKSIYVDSDFTEIWPIDS